MVTYIRLAYPLDSLTYISLAYEIDKATLSEGSL